MAGLLIGLSSFCSGTLIHCCLAIREKFAICSSVGKVVEVLANCQTPTNRLTVGWGGKENSSCTRNTMAVRCCCCALQKDYDMLQTGNWRASRPCSIAQARFKPPKIELSASTILTPASSAPLSFSLYERLRALRGDERLPQIKFKRG